MKVIRLCSLLIMLLFSACSVRPANFDLTLVHINDTHSHLEPMQISQNINGVRFAAETGGFARIKTVVDKMRKDDPELLFLHAGDAVQGTIFFTVFNGIPEYDFLNMLGVDAMTFGNHEFDRGTAPIPAWIGRSRFPWLSANIDFSAEPAIASLVKPYMIKEINGEKVAVIGVTTETTPQTTINSGKTVFMDAVESTRKQVAALASAGINKIILLSHLGYLQDKALAEQVAGVDIIVGGHSHSLLGDMSRLASVGLSPVGEYPTEIKGADGKKVLVLQAWQWGHFIGNIKINFTPDGDVADYSANPVIPVGDNFTSNGVAVSSDTDIYRNILGAFNRTGVVKIVEEDQTVRSAVAPYAAKLEQYRKELVAVAAGDMPAGMLGELSADSMLEAVPNAQVAVLNYGSMRKSLVKGNITVGDVIEVMPFSNTLVLIDLAGEELKQALEENIDFMNAKHGVDSGAVPYIGGASVKVMPSAARGSRVVSFEVRDKDGVFRPLEPLKIYRTVVNNFMAGGGDGFAAIKNARGFRSDTGIIDSDAFRDYLKARGSINNRPEKSVVVIKP